MLDRVGLCVLLVRVQMQMRIDVCLTVLTILGYESKLEACGTEKRCSMVCQAWEKDEIACVSPNEVGGAKPSGAVVEEADVAIKVGKSCAVALRPRIADQQMESFRGCGRKVRRSLRVLVGSQSIDVIDVMM